MNLTLYAGFAGAFLTLGSFALLKLRILGERALIYNLANFAGGFFLVFYAFSLNAWPFVITNTIWGLFGLKGLLTDNILKI